MSGIFSAMRRLACVVALVYAPLEATAAEPPPLSAFGNLPDIEDMALSNDGSRLAAVMTIGGERVVVLMTAELDTLRMLRIEEAKVRDMGRATQGVTLIGLDEGSKLSGLQRIVENDANPADAEAAEPGAEE